jgi:hypothetical protein
MYKEKGREPMFVGRIDFPDPEIQAMGHYLMSHALLPRDYGKIPVEAIISMGRLLLEKGIQRKTREAIMILLAHHGSKPALEALTAYNNMRPNEKLEVFARMALEECKNLYDGAVMQIDIV